MKEVRQVENTFRSGSGLLLNLEVQALVEVGKTVCNNYVAGP